VAEPTRPAPDPADPADPADPPAQGRRGLGIVLIALYGLFALAATGRATFQIIADFQKAPVSYLLSVLAAVIYLVATVALARGDRTSTRVARVAITVELVGVLVVGTVSYLVPSEFPDRTVWSHFGAGYGYVPLLLPVLGLLWLRSRARRGLVP
jgi:cytochrome bd-type quinol oxidase subunit 2